MFWVPASLPAKPSRVLDYIFASAGLDALIAARRMPCATRMGYRYSHKVLLTKRGARQAFAIKVRCPLSVSRFPPVRVMLLTWY